MLRNWIPWLWRSPRSVIGKWRPRRAKGLVLVWVQRLENQESEFVCEILSESESEGRRRPMSQLKDNEEREKILTLSFILSEHAVDWKRPTLMEEGAPLYSARWSRCESPADSLPDTSRVRVRQILGCPMTCTVKHHTILSSADLLVTSPCSWKSWTLHPYHSLGNRRENIFMFLHS